LASEVAGVVLDVLPSGINSFSSSSVLPDKNNQEINLSNAPDNI